MTKVILFGDPDSTKDADAIYAAIMKEENVDLYINGGDNGYKEEFERAKAMIDKYFPVGSPQRAKLRILLGNHDHEESEGKKAEAFFGAMFPDLYKEQTGFTEGDSSWENPKWLWSEHLNNELYFIGMNSQDEDIGFKRNQYNWVVGKELKRAKELRTQNKCRWILAGVHKPWVTKKSSHSAYTNHREVYGDDFFNVVNQMWYDHNHNDHIFRSWKPIKKKGNAAIEIVESLLPDGKTIDHSKPHGMTGNINGHSGHEHNEFKENMDVPEIMWYNDSTFSYAVVETNGNILNTKYKDKDQKILFEYNISDTTDYSNGTPPPPPGCLPSECKDPITKQCRPIGVNEIVDSVTGECMSTTTPTDPELIDPHCPDGYELVIVNGVCKCKRKGKITKEECAKKKNYHWDDAADECVPDLKPPIDVTPPPPPEPCKDNECKDPVTNQCRAIGADEIKDPNGFCKKKDIPPPDGEVLWDSNVHLKVDTETKVTDTFGDQKPDGKGIFMAASGNPRVIIQPDGIFYLEADSGHGRVYIKARNYNARMEGEIMFVDKNIRNSTWRLRSRHNMGGSNENKFGGFGATCEMEEQLAEYSTEPYHNVHENDIKKKLEKPMEIGKWLKFKYSVCDSPDRKEVLFKTEYDYGDGRGFVQVLEGKHSSPKPYYMDKALYDEESYAWLRVNNEKTGKVGFRNVRIIKIDKIT